MLMMPSAVRILLAADPIDMRNSIDGLCAVIRNGWNENLYAGHLFVFISKRGDKAKILAWDYGGFVLTYKRLEQGRFRVPAIGEGLHGAAMDRLLHHAHVLTIEGDSFRNPPSTKRRKASGAPADAR